MTRPLPQKSAGSLRGPGMFAVAFGPPLIVITVPGPPYWGTVVEEPPSRTVVGWAESATTPAWQTEGAERPSGYG